MILRQLADQRVIKNRRWDDLRTGTSTEGRRIKGKGELVRLKGFLFRAEGLDSVFQMKAVMS